MDIARTFAWSAERHSGCRAVGGRRPMTYRQWDARTNQLARALAQLGVRPGSRVALVMANGEPLASLHLAVQKLGAATVPLSTRLSSHETGYCLRDSEPSLLVTDRTTSAQVAPALDQLPAGCRHGHIGELEQALPGAVPLDRLAAGQPDGLLPAGPTGGDLSVMLYTSGTTGPPKGVPRTHAAEHAATVAHLLQARHRPGAVTLGVMPLFHTMGMRTLLASVAAGGTWVPQPRFDAEESLELIAQEQITTLYLVPTVYWSMHRTGRLGEARSVRRLAYAGAPMSATLAQELVGTLRPEAFVNHLGSTEIYTFTVEPDVAARPGSSGRAGYFARVRLVAPYEHASPEEVVAPGEQGQLIVSMESPEAFGGYWRRPDADLKAIRDGWYYTGDLAVRDEAGDLHYQGRVDDMINFGGENIHPAEIEAELARCPVVSEVAVAGVPDPKWGQLVTAFVVPGADALLLPEQTAREVRAFVRQRASLPALKRPKRVVVVERLPRSAAGKLLRRQLIAAATDDHHGQPATDHR